ncbi:MarP family serine protease [Micrococcoides hystricis]|uniref:MarP family serine protease n=1 Tax=Micrococcoides hystricis TaxID=1572761 RepID=A0ABV6PD45_9MICC
MNFLVLVVDLLLIVVMISFFVSGARRGFWVTLGTLVGFVAGATLSFLSIPLVSQWVGNPYWRLAVVLIVAILLIFMGQAVGAALGKVIRLRLNVPGLRKLDRFMGGLINSVVAVVAYAVIAYSLSSLGVPWLTTAISQSKVVSAITAVAPTPTKEWLANLRSTVQGSDIPELVEPLFPTTEPTADPTDVPIEDALATARRSVVRITGTAFECGQNQFGSGVAISPTHVLTNAHVVSGVNEPVIETNTGVVETATVVFFDASKDMAVLYVPGAEFAPIEPGGALPRDAEAVLMGYPAGGPFRANSATIQGSGKTNVPNIYGGEAKSLEIYQFTGQIKHGNSGGPLISQQGKMAALVFAKAQGTDRTGYALTMKEVTPVIDEAKELTEPVSAGQCMVGN